MGALKTSYNSLEKRYLGLEIELVKTKNELSDVKEALKTSNSVKQNAANVKQNAANVKQNAATVKQNAATVKQNAANVKLNAAIVKQDAANMKQNTANVEQNASNVKQNVANGGKTHPKDDKSAKTDDARSSTAKHKVVWIGTSVSKALDSKKFEKDLKVKLKMVKAYCVNAEGRFPDSSFKSIVPEAIKDADTVVLQTGSIEITNIDVNKAMVDSNKELDEYKNEWFAKVDKASSSLFKIAEECVSANPNLNVIIVKRPPRFDRSSKDILGIKRKLSEFGNHTYDQLHIKSNYSERIHLVEMNLVQNSKYLREIIYGSHDDPRFDGVHMIASEST